MSETAWSLLFVPCIGVILLYIMADLVPVPSRRFIIGKLRPFIWPVYALAVVSSTLDGSVPGPFEIFSMIIVGAGIWAVGKRNDDDDDRRKRRRRRITAKIKEVAGRLVVAPAPAPA